MAVGSGSRRSRRGLRRSGAARARRRGVVTRRHGRRAVGRASPRVPRSGKPGRHAAAQPGGAVHGNRAGPALADLERLHAAFSTMRDSMARPLTPSEVQAALDQQLAMARRHGTPEDMAAEGFRRNLTVRDGQACLRPLPNVLATLQAAMTDLDIIPVYRRSRALCWWSSPRTTSRNSSRSTSCTRHTGVASRSRLAEASDANPCLRVARVEGATHAMVAERPAEIAGLITRFAAPTAAGGPGSPGGRPRR